MVNAIEEENTSKIEDMTNPELKALYLTQRNLDCCSVFDNVYTKLLGKSKSLECLVRKVTSEVDKFKIQKSTSNLYEDEDFDVLNNLFLCHNILLPEHSNDTLEYLNALFQGSRDEEIAFWIFL